MAVRFAGVNGRWPNIVFVTLNIRPDQNPRQEHPPQLTTARGTRVLITEGCVPGKVAPATVDSGVLARKTPVKVLFENSED